MWVIPGNNLVIWDLILARSNQQVTANAFVPAVKYDLGPHVPCKRQH